MQKIQVHFKSIWLVRILSVVIFSGVAILAPIVTKQALAEDLTISGAVYDEAKQPLEQIEVSAGRMVHDPELGLQRFEAVISATTDASGAYLLIVPDYGPFRIKFADSISPARYQTEYHQGHFNPNQADDILFNNSNQVTGILGYLSPIVDFTIQGKVTDESGNAIEQIRVTANRMAGNPAIELPYWSPIADSMTDANGSYTITVAEAGPYRIGFADSLIPARYHAEYYDNASQAWQATDLHFDTKPTISDINAQLSAASIIVGQVTDTQGQAVNRVDVMVYQPIDEGSGQITWQSLNQGKVDSSGFYTMTLAYSGTVRVGFGDQLWPQRFNSTYYSHTQTLETATDITVTIGSVTPAIDGQVEFFGTVSGRVTNKNGEPIPQVRVSGHQIFTDINGSIQWPELMPATLTDSNGEYRLPVPNPVLTRICFNLQLNFTNFLPRCYGSNDGNPAVATDLPVQQGELVQGIDLQLGAYGLITGSVTNEAGQPIEYATVTAHRVTYNPDGSFVLCCGWWPNESDSSGSYMITKIESGAFVLSAAAMPPTEYFGEWYENQINADSAQVFTSEADSVFNIDFELVRKGNITGAVTDLSGQPLSDVAVTAFHYSDDGFGGKAWVPAASATTDASGIYTVTHVIPDTYRVGFGIGQDYIPEYYPHTTTVESASDIILGFGESASNIDGQVASLYRTITGQVTDLAGNPLAGIDVQLGFFEFGSWVFAQHAANTDASGNYTLITLPNGVFSIGFFDPSAQTIAEYYDNAAGETGALTFTIPSALPFSNINAQMSDKAHIRGNVTGPDGEPLPSHSVILFDEDLSQIAQTQTITDGSYELVVLGGVYRLCAGTTTIVTIYEPECYIDTNPSEIAAATSFSIENGNELTLDLQLAKKANPNGILEIALSSAPQSIRNLHFESSVGFFALDNPAVDDGDPYTNSKTLELPSDVYTLTLAMPSDRYFLGITCEGGGSWEVNQTALQIMLPANTTLRCTYQITIGPSMQTFSYHDANGDGMYNEGETAQAGISVTVSIAGSAFLVEKISDAEGLTEFRNLPPNNLFVVCQVPPLDWKNSQPGKIDVPYRKPCYWNPLNTGQKGLIRFGNIEANDPDFQNVPSTATDGYVVVDEPLVNDTDEENEQNEVQIDVFLPLISR